MQRSRSSIGRELLWLIVWIVLFAGCTTLLLAYVVPHHFNDRIAVMLAAIASSLAWIALRAYFTRRA